MSHCERGEEVILGMEAHSYRYEAGGVAVLGSIQPQAVTNRPDGTLDLAEVEAAIKPDDPHFARTRLLALENTITGRVLAAEIPGRRDRARAKRKNLATHLDGARVFNAATQLKMKVKDLCAGFDSVSSCLSKGLGAPAGTVLLGNKSFIEKAKRARKILGGGMRQSGVIAAAGLYALENNVERLTPTTKRGEAGARAARAEARGAAQHQHGLVKIPPDKAAAAGRAPEEAARSWCCRARRCAWSPISTWTQPGSIAPSRASAASSAVSGPPSPT